MKRVMIVQARAASSRLPGKVLVDSGGRPMLVQQFVGFGSAGSWMKSSLPRRPRPATSLWQSWLVRRACASSRCDRRRAFAIRGAARETAADVVVRVTADCPLIDPEVATG